MSTLTFAVIVVLVLVYRGGDDAGRGINDMLAVCGARCDGGVGGTGGDNGRNEEDEG